MRTTLVAALVGSAALLFASSASAQEFGRSGTLAFSADRLFGIYWHSLYVERGPVDSTHSGTAVNLLIGNSNPGGAAPVNPYAMPRFSFDGFVIDHLSIGGTIGFSAVSGSTENKSNGVSQSNDDADVSVFVFQPRVGYAIMFTNVVGLWPRGGFSYARVGVDDAAGTSMWGFNLTMECPLILSPAPHFAFTVGPVFDIGLTGHWNLDNYGPNTIHDGTARLHNLGLAVGLLTYL